MLAEIVWNEKSIAVAGAFAVPITFAIMSYWYKLGRARSENALKREMVARGMSADEIERIIGAAKKDEDE